MISNNRQRIICHRRRIKVLWRWRIVHYLRRRLRWCLNYNGSWWLLWCLFLLSRVKLCTIFQLLSGGLHIVLLISNCLLHQYGHLFLLLYREEFDLFQRRMLANVVYDSLIGLILFYSDVFYKSWLSGRFKISWI